MGTYNGPLIGEPLLLGGSVGLLSHYRVRS